MTREEGRDGPQPIGIMIAKMRSEVYRARHRYKFGRLPCRERCIRSRKLLAVFPKAFPGRVEGLGPGDAQILLDLRSKGALWVESDYCDYVRVLVRAFLIFPFYAAVFAMLIARANLEGVSRKRAASVPGGAHGLGGRHFRRGCC